MEERSDTEELGDVVNVGPGGCAEGLDGSRETETEGDRETREVEGAGGGKREEGEEEGEEGEEEEALGLESCPTLMSVS